MISVRGCYDSGEPISKYCPRPQGVITPAYMTLAKDVPCGDRPMSGCSIAVPIMAATAALVLQFASQQLKHSAGGGDVVMDKASFRCHLGSSDDDIYLRAYEAAGMRAIFDEATRDDDGPVHGIMPSRIFTNCSSGASVASWRASIAAALYTPRKIEAMPSIVSAWPWALLLMFQRAYIAMG